MPQFLDRLRREHQGMAGVLAALEREAGAFDANRHPDYDVVNAAAEYFRHFPDRHHHPNETLVFTRLRERNPRATDAIGDLAVAHQKVSDDLRVFTAGLRAILTDAELPRDAFARWVHGFIDAQRQHMTLEETLFFPAAEVALTTEDWSELEAMAAPSEPEPGAEFDRRLEALRQEILASSSEGKSVPR
jgi:hemerythrin-like domain-containing protein